MKPVVIIGCYAISSLLMACQPTTELELSAQNSAEQTVSEPSGVADKSLSAQPSSDSNLLAGDREKLTLYKSPTCGCCEAWADRVETSFDISSESTDNMAAVKQRFGVPAPMQSCHTSVSESGYVFEGHIPAKVIEAFLANPPEGAKGLAVPGMPIGSPGMEVDDQFTPFTVYLLTESGSTPYEQITSQSEL